MEDEAEAPGEDEEAREVGEKGMPVLVLRDRRTKVVTANVVPKKGPEPYAVRRLGQDITRVLGMSKCIKSDQEPAIKSLISEVRKEYQIDLAEEESGVGDSQANGEIENAIKELEKQIRVL